METCRACGETARLDPCEHCGLISRCTTCGEWLDGDFCRECGAAAPVAVPAGPAARSGTAMSPDTQAAPSTSRAGGHDEWPQSSQPQQRVAAATRPAVASVTPWRDSLPLGPPDDTLGGSLHWAFAALRSNGGGLTLVSLAAIGISAIGFFMAIVIIRVTVETELASITVAGWIVAMVVALAAVSWSAMALARAWSMAVRGSRIAVAEALSVDRYPSFVAITVILTPLTLYTAWLGFGFAATALLLVAGDDLSFSAALGRSLHETCRSSRRFFHTLLIGVVITLGQLTITLIAMVLFTQVVAGTATAELSSAFSGTSNEFRDADSNLTMAFGLVFVVLLWTSATIAMANLSGLWAAAHLRRLTGRPVGAAVHETGQLTEVPQ